MQNLTLRRVNTFRKSLRLGIPHKFVKARGLTEGDQVVWIEEADGVRLKFVRLADVAESRPRQEAEAPAAA
jgi:bifunctional DNA-binding transcriptional regulator/antitoxin component of YhaV-PrlF toxin-antitoxin module